MGVQLPQDLTDQERELGYQLQDLVNPRARAGGHAEQARAVVHQGTDPAERVVKVAGPAEGRVEYHRQLHGVWNPPVADDVPGWKTCGRHDDPAVALSASAREADLARLERPLVSSPPPVARQHGA